MLAEVEKMKRLGQFTKENMIAHGFIDADDAQKPLTTMNSEGRLQDQSAANWRPSLLHEQL